MARVIPVQVSSWLYLHVAVCMWGWFGACLTYVPQRSPGGSDKSSWHPPPVFGYSTYYVVHLGISVLGIMEELAYSAWGVCIRIGQTSQQVYDAYTVPFQCLQESTHFLQLFLC